MEAERMSYEDLANKIDWEGGLDEVLRYGIEPADVPEDLADDWWLLEAAFDVYAEIADRVSKRIEQETGNE